MRMELGHATQFHGTPAFVDFQHAVCVELLVYNDVHLCVVIVNLTLFRKVEIPHGGASV